MRGITGVIFSIFVLFSAVTAYAETDRVAHGDVVIGPNESVGDAVAFGGSLTIHGHVQGDATAFGGSVSLMPGSRVDGEIVAFGGSVVVSPESTSSGSHIQFPTDQNNHHVHRHHDSHHQPNTDSVAENHDSSGAGWFDRGKEEVRNAVQKVGHMLALFGLLVVLGMIMLGLAPHRTRALAAAVAAHPGKSLGLGLLVILGSALAILILSVTIIGIPVAVVLGAVVSCAAILGLTSVSILIGELLPFQSLRDRQFLKLSIGSGLLVLALAIPYVGGIFGVIATVLGLGSLAFTRLRPGHAVFTKKGGPYRSTPSF